MTEFSFLYVDRQPVKTHAGYAGATISYDKNGKLTEISMLDETGQLVSLASGMSRWIFSYDEKGKLLGQTPSRVYWLFH